MQFNDLVQHFGKELGVKVPPGQERYAFELDGEKLICLEKTAASYVLYAEVCAVPVKNRERAFQLLLEANLFGRATDRAVLAIDDQSDKVVLFQWFVEEVGDFNAFLEALDAFVMNLDYWAGIIETFEWGGGGESTPVPKEMKRV